MIILVIYGFILCINVVISFPFISPLLPWFSPNLIKKIKVFRSDSEGEYLSSVFRSLLTNDGTLPQLSCPGVPAQNGIAERKHRHILDTTCALLLATSVPTEFWAEVLLTAVHLINRLPSSVLNQDTPFYRLHSRSPTYTHLRVFGCTCFVILPPHERTKLTARSFLLHLHHLR